MSERSASSAKGALDLWSGVGLVVASMIGTGVLVSNGYMVAALAPVQTFAVWGLQAGLAIAGALAYARISQMIPRSGGEYRYLSELFHPALGYLAGWTSLLVGFAAPVAGAAYTAGSFAEEAGLGVPPRITAAVVIAVVTTSQVVDRQTAKWSQNLLVGIKAALFLALIGVGLGIGAHDLPTSTPEPAGTGVFAMNLFFAAYAFSGWNASIYAAEEFSRPTKDVARSMIIGVLLVTALYMVVTYVFVFNLTPADVASMGESRERGAHLLIAKLVGPGAAVVASIGIVVSLVSAASAMTFVGPRVNAAMASDGFLPHAFIAKKGRPPVAAILFQGVLALVLLFTHSVEGLVSNVGMMLTLMSAITVLGLIRVRFFPGDLEISAAPGPLALSAAFVYFLAACWMLYYAVRGGASGVLWMVGIASAATVAYVATRRIRSD